MGLTLLGTGYLVLRFDLQSIPEGGCSALRRFSAGDRLIVDRWAPTLDEGDAVLFDGGEEYGLLLGRIETREGQGGGARYWVSGDRSDCPTPGSVDFGWLQRDRISSRVLMAWPW